MDTVQLPVTCPSCGAKNLNRHCEPGMGRCDWLRCGSCKAITAVILGKLRTAR